MMKYVVLYIALVFVTAPAQAQVSTIEIPVPELCGQYDLPNYPFFSRTAQFSIEGEYAQILSANFRVSGIADIGLIEECGTGVERIWPIVMSVYIPDESTGGSWSNSVGSVVEGEFQNETYRDFLYFSFDGVENTTLDFLLDGEHEISMSAHHGSYNFGECPVEWPGGIYITKATLILSITSSTPDENYSLGGIKALYR